MNKFTFPALLALFPLSLHAADFNAISNFGDSLSDMGNKHLITVDMNQATSGNIGIRALEPNVNGRFSNGPVWTEYLATFLDMPAPTRAHGRIESTLELTGPDGKQVSYQYQDQPLAGTNWATGGAMSGPGRFLDIDAANGFTANSGLDVLSNSGLQIQQRIHSKGQFSGSELVSYMSGTNNLWFTLFGDLGQSGDKAAVLALKDIESLIDAGATQILAANIPNFVDAPWFAGQQDKVTQFIGQHNQALKAGLEKLASSHPDIEIFHFDAFAAFDKVINEVKQNGQYHDADLAVTITDVTGEAYSYATGKVIAKPNNNLYWDGLHPTTAMHKVIAKDAANLVKAGIAL
ncbi:SGNH/GDSL hydrolase family protein [Photobacterium sp. OFAV2-7]|uniref:SGNH/GDSL hydrolase family protein n=1 Tax=Photobacterium sp. OFAV2-7 TaxID=2917748 RepID=UPI001EF64E2C|nr:SGNH/GDSL hydrolase family protein [Photobacterium sp. OFAV2-7]MCG7584516.1 SGNH/GDSL hydrolase family protein [Photobacterium sp. OFAV2-7]